MKYFSKWENVNFFTKRMSEIAEKKETTRSVISNIYFIVIDKFCFFEF